MRVIQVVATGGTIAMRRDAAAGGNVPALGGAALVALAPELAGMAEVRVDDFARRPACHLGDADLWRVRERVREVLADSAVEGVVVTHGTDLLEETAYLLDRTLAPRVPVVVTGAMRTSDDADWDGRRNLVDAVRVALAGRPGVYVAFAGRVLAGMEAVKGDAFAVDAFGAPHAAAVGTVVPEGVRWERERAPHATLAPTALDRRALLVAMNPGDDGALVDAAAAGADGLVVASFGSGNTPPGAIPAIGRALAAGKAVVLASRCAAGRVTPAYAFEGGSRKMVEMGCIPAGPRTPWQARLELAIALSAGAPYAAGLPA